MEHQLLISFSHDCGSNQVFTVVCCCRVPKPSLWGRSPFLVFICLWYFSEEHTSNDLTTSVHHLIGVSCSSVGHLKSMFFSVKDLNLAEIFKTTSKH